MDERLQKVLDFSNYMTTVNTQKRLLRERYEEGLIHYAHGAQFKATKELITFIDGTIRSGREFAVLIDDNGTPILIKDLVEFHVDLSGVYAEASNEFYVEYEKLKKNRKIEGLLDL